MLFFLPLIFLPRLFKDLFAAVHVVVSGLRIADGLRTLQGLFEHAAGFFSLSGMPDGVCLRPQQPRPSSCARRARETAITGSYCFVIVLRGVLHLSDAQ